MTAREFAEWRAYYALEPFGSWRDNYHAAMIAHILAMVNSDPKKSRPRFENFFYRDHESVAQQQRGNVVRFFRSHAMRTQAEKDSSQT